LDSYLLKNVAEIKCDMKFSWFWLHFKGIKIVTC